MTHSLYPNLFSSRIKDVHILSFSSQWLTTVYRLNSNKECHPLKKKTCYLRKELRKTPRPIKKAHNQQNRPEVNCSMREAIE